MTFFRNLYYLTNILRYNYLKFRVAEYLQYIFAENLTFLFSSFLNLNRFLSLTLLVL